MRELGLDMIIGFTGTRKGMTERQKAHLWEYLDRYCDEFHHGDCIGADAEAHDIAWDLGIRVVIHPCDLETQRAYKIGSVTLPVKPPLERNKDIVEACELLLAAPSTTEEELRSGTWATIRYAKRCGIRGFILKP